MLISYLHSRSLYKQDSASLLGNTLDSMYAGQGVEPFYPLEEVDNRANGISLSPGGTGTVSY